MLRVPCAVPGLVALLLSAGPAAGARFLYATASQGARVDVFPLDGAGGILGRQSTIGTDGTQPRRLVVDRRADGTSCTLYAAELDRLQAFRIRKNGDLQPIGTTTAQENTDPYDIAVGPDPANPQYLYEPQRQPARIVAYPILRDGSSRDGAVQGDFSSCVQGRPGAGYETIVVANGLVYVSAVDVAPSIEAYLATDSGIGGFVCPAQNPGRIYRGPGTAAELAAELNPDNIQCYPDPQRAEQFPVTVTNDSGVETSVVSYLHTNPADTGTSTEESVRLNDLRKTDETTCGGKAGGTTCQKNEDCANEGAPSDRYCGLSPRIFYTCPSRFTPDHCDPESRLENPGNRIACPVSLRRTTDGAQSFVVSPVSDQQWLFIDQIFVKAVSSVLLQPDGNFPPFLCKPDKDTNRTDSPPCSPDTVRRNAVGAVKGGLVKQPKLAQQLKIGTKGYSTIFFQPNENGDGGWLYGPRFLDGIVDVVRVKLKADESTGTTSVRLSRPSSSSSTKGDLRSSPFRVTVHQGVLYVAAGSFDRVQAFRLRDGKPAQTPFSSVDVPDGSFPNDVVVAVPGDDCPG